MITFLKTREEDDKEYDYSDVVFECDTCITLPDLIEEFNRFIVAAGYNLPHNSKIDIIDETDYDNTVIDECTCNCSKTADSIAKECCERIEKTLDDMEKTVTIKLTDDDFNVFANLAHEDDGTITQYINGILRDYVDAVTE